MANITTQNQNNAVAVNSEAWVTYRKQFFPSTLSNDDFEHFIKVCSIYRLDPTLKQIYAIPRNVHNKQTNQWTKVLSIVISIEGARILSRRSGNYQGQTMPEYCGDDGKWTEVWSKTEKPIACRVGIFTKDCPKRPIYGISYYSERDKNNVLYDTYTLRMLAKNAEANALKIALPDDIMHSTSGNDFDEQEQERYIEVDVVETKLQNQPANIEPAKTEGSKPKGVTKKETTSKEEPAPTPQPQPEPVIYTEVEEELITDEQKAQIIELLNHELIDSSAKKATLTNLDKFTKERAEQCLRNITQTIEMKKTAKRDKEALKEALKLEKEEGFQQPQTQPPQGKIFNEDELAAEEQRRKMMAEFYGED